MGALSVVMAVLSARLIVLVAVAGGIALTYIALEQPDVMRLGALGIYAGAIVIPSVILAVWR